MTLKTIILLGATAIFIACSSPNTDIATNATKEIKVWGNCEMCKETIEASLKVPGVIKADWNVDSKILRISFDSTIINSDQIAKNIASVGYDNDIYKGNNAAYSELHECCQYERK